MSKSKTIGNKTYTQDAKGDWYESESPVLQEPVTAKVINGVQYHKDDKGDWYEGSPVEKKKSVTPSISSDGKLPSKDIPEVTMYGNNEIVPDNDFDKAIYADELRKRTKVQDNGGGSSFGMGTTNSTVIPDEDAAKIADQIDAELATKKVNSKKIAKDFEGINTEDFFSHEGTTKEYMLKLDKENPIKYNNIINNAKTVYAIADNSDIHTANRFNQLNDIPYGSLGGFISGKQEQQDIINSTLTGDAKLKAHERLKENASPFINAANPDLVDEYNNSPVKNKIDANQYAGLKTLQIFEPEKYQLALDIINTDNVPTGGTKPLKNLLSEDLFSSQSNTKPNTNITSYQTTDKLIGKETILRQLSEQGRSNLKTSINREQYGLNSEFEKTTDPIREEQIKQQYLSNQNFIKSIDEDAKQDDIKYPITAKLKFENQAKEITQQAGLGMWEYGANRFGKGFLSTANTIEDVVTGLFGSDKDNIKLQEKRLGEGQRWESQNYLPENLKSENSPYILKPTKELKDEAKKILNGRNLSDLSEVEKSKLTELVKNNQDQIETITNPEFGKSKNIFTKATGYQVAGFTGDIASFMAQTMGLGAVGLPAKAAELTTLFTTAYAPSFDEATKMGMSHSQAHGYGMVHGGIMMLAGTVSSKFENVKNMLAASKSPLSKEILGIGEAGWNKIVNGNKSTIAKIADATKNVAKENAKMIATYGVGTSIVGDLANKGFFNQNISNDEIVSHAVQSAKDMAIGSLAMAGVGFISHIAKNPISLLEKTHIWEAGDNPEIGKAKIDEAIVKGDLTQQEGDLRKKAVDNISNLIQKVPQKNDKGKDLTDKEKVEYLYNSVVKDKAKEAAKDLPPKQAEVADEKALVAEHTNQIILDQPTETQLQATKKRLEAKLEPKKDAEGKAIEIPEADKKQYQAELQAVNDALNKPKEVVLPTPEKVLEGTEQSDKDVVVDEGVGKVKNLDNSVKNTNLQANEAGSNQKANAEGQNQGIADSPRPLIQKSGKEKTIADRAKQIEDITDPYDKVLQHFSNDGKIHGSAIEELFGGKDSRIRIKSSTENERRARISLIGKDAPTIDKLAHDLWESDNTGKYTTEDYKDAIERVLSDYNSKAAMQKDLVERYDTEAAYEKYINQTFGEEAIDVVNKMSDAEINEILRLEADKENSIALENYIESLSTQKSKPLDEGVVDKTEAKIENNENKAQVTQDTNQEKETGINNEPPDKNIQTAGEETGGNPPKEPVKPVEEGGGKDKLNDKGILNHLESAENIPEQAKAGFKEKGLKYTTSSQKEAEGVAKSIIDKYGIEDATLLAEAQKFDGDVNSLIYAESLNRLGKLELEAKTPEEKLAIAKQFAEVGIKYDEAARKGGRFNSAINYFYKKSPLGIQMIENAKRKEDFEGWAKPKDKSWKEFFDEMVKEPEFDAIIKEQVKEGMKKERAEARAVRIKKVDDAFDAAKSKFEGGAAYSTIIPPKVITVALEGMKQAYHAGEKVAKIIEDAVDYISEQMGNAAWDKDKFRKEWSEKLKDKEEKKPLSDEQLKAKLLDRFRNKLKGLTDKQKEDVVRKSFKKIVDSGGLDYADFRNIIAEVTGRSEMTEAEAAKLKQLVTETNAVDAAGEKARTERTQESRKLFREVEIKAGRSARELNELLYNKPNITKRLTSLMQLNTLGFPALINNPIYNVVNTLGVRFPVGVIKSGIDKSIYAIGKAFGRDIKPETNVFSVQVQKEFFKKLGLGTRESVGQFLTGMNRMDYMAKEIQGQAIRPATAIKDLWEYHKGTKNLTKAQIIDKIIQASPPGITAEIIARTLNLGDKPQRFAAEGAQAAAFAKGLGLKDIDYDLFIDFPREEAYTQLKKQGLSDTKAAERADYIRDTILKEGERSTFQQDNMLNDILSRVFGGKDNGVGQLAKATVVSPYIKIPSNAYWSYYNIVNPEVAMLQSMIYAGKAVAKKNGVKFSFDKPNSSAAKDINEAKYWLAHAAVGMATRGVIVALVSAGIFRSGNTQSDTKKEREGEQFYEDQGTINVSKLSALMQGKDPDKVKNGLVIKNKWFGHWGTVGNTIARKYEDMTTEQKKEQSNFWDVAIGGMELEALQDFNQGVFGNTSSLLSGINQWSETGKIGSGMQAWGVNTLNMFANIVHPAAFAQIERASLPYYTKQKADTFLGELKNSMLTRSSVLRELSGQYPPSKIGIWGNRLDKKENTVMSLFGISHANPDNFAQPIYEDYKKTNNTEFFPPSVKPEVTVDGKRIKLPTKQANELEEYVGRNRKDYIAPFINGMAEYDGYKYSDLKSNESKIAALKIIYNLGFEKGLEQFKMAHKEYGNVKEEEDAELRKIREQLNQDFKESLNSAVPEKY